MLISVLIFVIIHIHLWWALSLVFKRNDLADLAWGVGLLGIGTVSFLEIITYEIPVRKAVFLVCLSLWALRLSFFLVRRIRAHKEDFRYTEMRSGWKKNHRLQAYFKVFWLQALMMVAVSLPILQVMSSPRGSILYPTDLIGLFFFIIGFSIESASDAEKKAYFLKPENKGTFIRKGLWEKCRHPNYFGEILLWIGLSLFSFTDFPDGWWALLGPVTIATLIIKVTGLPLLEKRLQQKTGWEDYKKETRALWPF